ncbi:hypothetical protein BDE40_3591 [Litoreibacter halocynthiae]|uniref:Uncharacterized protein n=1 Tax=Litoreibacter halocynthiae TaxID=1242689 RepID=A0A4R7LB88_9RHOB|nr:hypothetical protein [Litoreibacter halocynthiae]TDT72738.1 hypothetical protein BDE40_3591 [Litoreibacter halocynthiae]
MSFVKEIIEKSIADLGAAAAKWRSVRQPAERTHDPMSAAGWHQSTDQSYQMTASSPIYATAPYLDVQLTSNILTRIGITKVDDFACL